jgi:hypothetical protein
MGIVIVIVTLQSAGTIGPIVGNWSPRAVVGSHYTEIEVHQAIA